MMSTRVPIKDDEESLRKLIVSLISLEGHEVKEASSIKEARSALKRHHFDIIHCDVR